MTKYLPSASLAALTLYTVFVPSGDKFEGLNCESDMECEEATGYPYDVALQPDAPKYPRLVGHGCKGAAGPIYAFEVEHFPVCREIVPMNWDWKSEAK